MHFTSTTESISKRFSVNPLALRGIGEFLKKFCRFLDMTCTTNSEQQF